MYFCSMIKDLQIQVSPEEASKRALLLNIVAKKLQIEEVEITHLEILKRSTDARQKIVKINLKLRVCVSEKHVKAKENLPAYKDANGKEEIIIIGAGPAGLFAALKLLEKGKKPIVIERGKAVQERRKDIAKLTKEHIVNKDSNYCFGEGGAGTFSDGKLYTRSKKRGDVNKILDVLIMHGATPEIRVDAHPHIGTNKLPQIIQKIRETILEYGGEFIVLSESSFTPSTLLFFKIISVTRELNKISPPYSKIVSLIF